MVLCCVDNHNGVYNKNLSLVSLERYEKKFIKDSFPFSTIVLIIVPERGLPLKAIPITQLLRV